jgi:hypothetical protein
VRDFVREYWKSAAAGAVGSFLLSLLIGLVTRNPFGVVFLRALLLAALFACLAAAMRYLVRTHLLELAREGAAAHAGGGDTREDGRGGRVDIVLPAEGPVRHGRSGTGIRDARPLGAEDEDASPLGAELGEDADVPGGLSTDLPGGSGAGDKGSEGLAELAEELAEELPQPGENLAAQPVEADEEGDGRKGADTSGTGSERSDDRDGLPDISNLEIATEMEGDKGGTAARPGGARPEDALRGSVSGQDPATIARAIRTVLKRDDKG